MLKKVFEDCVSCVAVGVAVGEVTGESTGVSTGVESCTSIGVVFCRPGYKKMIVQN